MGEVERISVLPDVEYDTLFTNIGEEDEIPRRRIVSRHRQASSPVSFNIAPLLDEAGNIIGSMPFINSRILQEVVSFAVVDTLSVASSLPSEPRRLKLLPPAQLGNFGPHGERLLKFETQSCAF